MPRVMFRKPLNPRLLDQVRLDELVGRIYVQENVRRDVQRKKPLNPRFLDQIQSKGSVLLSFTKHGSLRSRTGSATHSG